MPLGGTLKITRWLQGEADRSRLEPQGTFLMRGIGYGGEWRHGGLRGELEVAREDIDLATVDMAAPENWHIQAISKAVIEAPGEPAREGVGVFEQLIAGPYRPYRRLGPWCAPKTMHQARGRRQHQRAEQAGEDEQDQRDGQLGR